MDRPDPLPRLRELSFANRLLLTLYVLAILAGMAASFAFHAKKSGTRIRELAEYYQGTDLEADEGGDLSGPLTIHDRPSDLRLLQVLHPHAFAVPLLLLVQLLLFNLAVRSERVKLAAVAIAFLSYASLFASPWIARESLAGVYLLATCSAVFHLLLVAVSLAVLKSLWSREG